MSRYFSIVVTLVAALLALALPASAQIVQPTLRPDRPSRGLFGGGVGDASQQLILNVSFGGGFDDDLLAESTGSTFLPPGTQTPRSGQFGFGNTGLNYSVDGQRVRASLGANAAGRYYPTLDDPFLGAYSAAGQVSVTLSPKTAFSTSHQISLQPYNSVVFYGGGFDAGTEPGAPIDLTSATTRRVFQMFRSAVDLQHQLTRRLSLGAGYQYYAQDNWSDDAGRRYLASSASARIGFELAKGLSLRLGYVYQDARFGTLGPATPYRGRTIDGGLDFNRSLSVSRRSTLAFSTGLAGLNALDGKTRYFVVGNANYAYELGRSWSFNASYRRSADFFQTLEQPVLLDSASVGVGGLIGRRVQVMLTAGTASGSLGVVAGASGYGAATGNASIQWGLTRALALSLNYGFYHYRFDLDATIPDGFPRELNRQSIRLSLDVWAPLVIRARRANASR